eukprot:scaffold4996_cov82-Skeletonema_dohrnii-CCMP3373.AAC.3
MIELNLGSALARAILWNKLVIYNQSSLANTPVECLHTSTTLQSLGGTSNGDGRVSSHPRSAHIYFASGNGKPMEPTRIHPPHLIADPLNRPEIPFLLLSCSQLRYAS